MNTQAQQRAILDSIRLENILVDEIAEIGERIEKARLARKRRTLKALESEREELRAQFRAAGAKTVALRAERDA